MDYTNVFYQLGKISHYSFAFVLLFIVVPGFLFKSYYDNWGEKIVSKYIVMVFTVIIIGYLLVLTKLFEVISLSIVFLVLLTIRYWELIKAINKKPTITYWMKSLFDLFEGIHYFNGKIIKKSISIKFALLRSSIKERYQLEHFIELALLLIIISICVYIRSYDLFKNAAPPLSDSYVTLAWMKYIDSRVLFHDGIYPQGFHIYLATLFKFSAVDALFILRYTGPFNSVLITLGIYFVVRRLSSNGIGAIIAVALYGWLITYIHWFPSERQVGTNSQEFAFVFIFPVLYFLLNYCLTQTKKDLYYGMLGTAVIGLIHSFAFMFIGLLIGILIISYCIQMKKISRVVINLIVFSLVTVGIAIIPFGVGMLEGRTFHSSSVEYLLSNDTHQFFPNLEWVDYFALASMVIIFLMLFSKRLSQKEYFIILFTFLSSLVTFGLYYFGGILTNSVLVASRSLELWGLMVPFCIGICFSFLSKLFINKPKVTYSYLTIVIIITLILFKPSPIIAYKLEHNANIEQYLKIAENHRPKTWLMVSNDEGYSVVLGTGFHMHLYDFLKKFDSEKAALTYKGESKPDPTIPPYIYILKEKNIFKVSETNSVYSLLKPKYEQREKDYEELDQWIETYKNDKKHKVQIFYEDKNIIIYYLENKASLKVMKKMKIF